MLVKSTEDIQTKLDKKLGPEYISKRVGYGSNRVVYIEGWKAINLANQIFGYNGWSTEVKSVSVDFMDEKQGRYCIGCTAIVRVTLTDGTFREDIGYGTVENERRKSSAFERAKKSAVTDALKRSLRGFGNALGNCLYDKDFLSKIDKVKFDPPDFDEGNLFRPTDELSEISRSNTVDQEISTSSGRPMKRRNTGALVQQTSRPVNKSNGLRNETQPPSTPVPQPQQQQQPQPQPQPQQQQQQQQDQDDLLDDSFIFSDDFQDDDIISVGKTNNGSAAAPVESMTFVTAKAAPTVQNKAPVPSGEVFDPKYQAHSIQHTVDQSTSKHVKASVLKEKGLEDKRNAMYQRFAPKGKQLDTINTPINNSAKVMPADKQQITNTPNRPAAHEQPKDVPQINNQTPTSNRAPQQRTPRKAQQPFTGYQQQTSVAPPPTVPPTTTAPPRREVGRPKVNHPNIRKPAQ